MHFDFVREIGRLQANPDPVLQRLLLPVGIETENGHIAAAPRTQTFEHLDRGRLPGAVRTEQTEDFASLHFNIDPFDGFERPVGLAQTARMDGWIAHPVRFFRLTKRGSCVNKKRSTKPPQIFAKNSPCRT